MQEINLEKITVVCRVTIGKLKHIEMSAIQSVPRGIPLEGRLREFAVSEIMSTVGSCSCVARRCDPKRSPLASMMQQKQRDPIAEDVEWTNQVADEVAKNP